jgi:hypothetical protein
LELGVWDLWLGTWYFFLNTKSLMPKSHISGFGTCDLELDTLFLIPWNLKFCPECQTMNPEIWDSGLRHLGLSIQNTVLSSESQVPNPKTRVMSPWQSTMLGFRVLSDVYGNNKC